MVSGWYRDDDDNENEILYTGQGGNDLHGKCLQVKDQKLVAVNLALLNNAKYGVPVRVIKKNDKKFIYDGLWDVLQMIKVNFRDLSRQRRFLDARKGRIHCFPIQTRSLSRSGAFFSQSCAIRGRKEFETFCSFTHSQKQRDLFR